MEIPDILKMDGRRKQELKLYLIKDKNNNIIFIRCINRKNSNVNRSRT